MVCPHGGWPIKRHHAIRNMLADVCAEADDMAVHKEQAVPKWTTTTTTAILDLVLAAECGQTLAVDVVVTHPVSSHNLTQAGAKDGAAACKAERRKHIRYPGPGLTAAALEVYGRPGEELQGFVRARAGAMPEPERAVFVQTAWQLIAATLQKANAAALDAAGASVT